MMNDTDWQLECIGIKSRGALILKTGEFSDCKFLVGQKPGQETVCAHKLILAMASPVFQAMFYGGISECEAFVDIVDVEPDVFKSLLVYIYTDVVDIDSVEKACELYYAAKKYMFPHLTKECNTYISSNLNKTNVLMVYEFARFNDNEELMDQCVEVICKHTKEVLNDSSFTKASLETVCMIFSMDPLNIDSELDLLKAAERYLKANEECAFLPNDNVPSKTDKVYKKAGEDCTSAPESKRSPSLLAQRVDDEARSEATFCFTVQNIRTLEDAVTSPPCFIRNLQWVIEVDPVTDSTSADFWCGVSCEPNSKSTCWSCYASVELKIIEQKPGSKPFRRKVKQWFHRCSFVDYDVSRNGGKDQKNEYMKDDTVTIEAHVVVEAAHGVTWGKQRGPDCRDKMTIRNAVRLIRFLSLTGKQFAEEAVNSRLLDKMEERAILVNILGKRNDVPMPRDFMRCKEPRK